MKAPKKNTVSKRAEPLAADVQIRIPTLPKERLEFAMKLDPDARNKTTKQKVGELCDDYAAAVVSGSREKFPRWLAQLNH